MGEQGIFKHARGVLRGWKLETEEQERVEQQADVSELVLQRRPLKLYIEVPSANAKLAKTNGKKIFVLSMCMKRWSLDRDNKVPVKRYGFPIVPDFGGTAHAYCGDTLRACLGDLMKWYLVPSLEQALRAYIIKSRIRDADNLLLAQPYSPMLLRQGVQPGPQLLLETLQKKITPKEARAKWEDFEAAQKEEEKTGSHWQDRLRLPCRRCSDKGQVEVLKPLKAFPMPGVTQPEEIWRSCISEGQDLNCFDCRRQLWRLKREKGTADPGLHCMYCSTCDTPRGFEYFSAADQQTWKDEAAEQQEFTCLPCSNRKPVTNTDEAPKHLCTSCDQILPYYHYVPQQLNAWKHQGTVEQAAQCARCYTRQRSDISEEVQYKCKQCKTTKHIRDFDAVTIRSWMEGKRLEGSHWTCYECHYPLCGLCPEPRRPMHAVVHNAWVSEADYYRQAKPPSEAAKKAFETEKKRWFCLECKYPPCASQRSSECAKTRLQKRELRFQTWTCKPCQSVEKDPSYPACGLCGQRPINAVAPHAWISEEEYYKQAKPASEAARKAFQIEKKRWFCLECKYPACASQRYILYIMYIMCIMEGMYPS